ncbi:hypothetical protein XM47_18660 [Catenovulum maritimum]|uniref:Uncharacterized protein n=1 Tax=Catenovulum maritimum TaxID=1513271 RepID=A0A0J8GLG1_9ALTE|nr:hypothetical protein XM47_18660 [Catenovulum maritimum]
MQTFNEWTISFVKFSTWLIITLSCLITIFLNPNEKFIFPLFMVMTFADWVFLNNKEENKKFFFSEIKLFHLIGMIGVLFTFYMFILFWEAIKSNLGLSDGDFLQFFVLLVIPLVFIRYYKKIREIKT